MIAAIERAQALLKHASHCGEPMHNFAIMLSDKEGIEALNWLVDQPQYQTAFNMQALRFDVAACTVTGNPWPVLDCIQIMGLPCIRVEETLQ